MCTSRFVTATGTSILPPSFDAPLRDFSICYLLRTSLPMLTVVQSGLVGGTFDPPHIAHLLAGEVGYRQLGLDRVIFMPAGSPWQKAGRRVSPAPHRWTMTELAVSGVDYFHPDDREVHRNGWTYTADTLESFPSEEEITLILGADAALGLPTWNRFAEVMARVHLAVVPRAGIDPAAVEERVKVENWLDMPSLPVSGTMIRDRVRSGLGFRFLVTDEVYAYIGEQGLYRD